jgi:hypothetical protein
MGEAGAKSEPGTQTPPLSEQAVEFLTRECERMLSLYSQAQANAQSVFNFYLTFVTTVVGAVVVIVQIAPPGSDTTRQADWVLGGVLLFAAVVGSVYLSALSGRYAHAARYSLAVDEIRRYLIERLQVPTPPVYETFLKGEYRAAQGYRAWVYWLTPTGTYAMFMAMINSAAFAAVTWLVFASAGTSAGRGLIAALIVFILVMTISNIYSRLVIMRFGRSVSIHLWKDSPAWAARE